MNWNVLENSTKDGDSPVQVSVSYLDSDTDAKRTMGSQASERTFISKTKPHDRTPKVRSLNEHGKIVTVYGPPPTGNYQK